MSLQFNDFGRYRSGNTLFINEQGMHDLQFSDEFPMMIDCYLFSRNFILTPNFHDYLELTYVYEGEGVFSAGREVFPVRPGDLIVVGNSEIHRFESTVPKLKLAALFFLPKLIFKPGISQDEFSLIEFFFDFRKISHHIIPAEITEQLKVPEALQEIYTLHLEKKKNHRINSRIILMAMLSRLSEYYDNLTAETTKSIVPVYQLERLKKVFQIVEKRYHEKIDLDSVVAELNLSRGYFCRFFRQQTGMSLSEYINRYRIDKAKELLLRGRYSITQLAYEVGFESLPYFYRVFKELTGMSPGEFEQTFTE